MKALGLRVTTKQKNIYIYIYIYLLYDRNVACTEFLTKYSECDLLDWTTEGGNSYYLISECCPA